jgi:hypothetical protein
MAPERFVPGFAIPWDMREAVIELYLMKLAGDGPIKVTRRM